MSSSIFTADDLAPHVRDLAILVGRVAIRKAELEDRVASLEAELESLRTAFDILNLKLQRRGPVYVRHVLETREDAMCAGEDE